MPSPRLRPTSTGRHDPSIDGLVTSSKPVIAFVQVRLATAAQAEIQSVWGLSRSPCSSIIPGTRSLTVSRSLAIRVKRRGEMDPVDRRART